MRFIRRKILRENLPIDQDATVNEDGSVTLDLQATGPQGGTLDRSVTAALDDDGGIDLQTTFATGRTRATEIDEDPEDAGVDVVQTVTTADGQILTRTIELDLTEDGQLSFEAFVTGPQGNSVERDLEFDAERFVSEQGLSVQSVAEAILSATGVDTSVPDLIGILGEPEADLIG
ncbi:MAG: hypothetical protein ACFB22_06970 [Rhodothalassiaceae bacterium]